MTSQKYLSILIPSIGERSSFELFEAISRSINSNPRIRDHVELILFVSGNPFIHNKYSFMPVNSRIITDTDRLGASMARNRLALASSSEFISFCDADSFIFSEQTFSVQLLSTLSIISASPGNRCYVFSDSASMTLSPFSFRLTEWNFIVSRDLFISLNMFPSKVGVGSSSMVQSGEAQFLFNAMYQCDVVFLPLAPLFGHPQLGTVNEAVELFNENKLRGYNYGATFSTVVLFILRFSSLSFYHLLLHLVSFVILTLRLPFAHKVVMAMISGRIHGFFSAIVFVLKGNTINQMYLGE